MSEQKQSEEMQKKSDDVQLMFREALVHYAPSLERMMRMQEAYECKLPDDWGTYSELFLPHVRTAAGRTWHR